MKFYINLLAFLCLLLGITELAKAQHGHACGIDHATEILYQKDPSLRDRAKESLNNIMDNFVNKLDGKGDDNGLIPFRTVEDGDFLVPVVVHVLYGCEDEEEDLPMERIEAAIQMLNDDFSAQNPDLVGTPYNCQYPNRVGDMGVTFALAHKDENGNPTNGVNRVRTNKTYLGIGGSEELADVVQWDRTKYMNIYILNKVTPQNNSGVAHYPESSDDKPALDAVCMAHWAVAPEPGSYRRNYDYILTHEVGHWFGLRHIWGDGNAPELEANCSVDDFDFLQEYLDDNNITSINSGQVNDTPLTSGHSTLVRDVGEEEEECDSDRITCTSGIDMFDNFMDYSGCARMFSTGQVDYMESLFSSGVAGRGNLVSEGNISDVFYEATTTSELLNNTTSRAIFERSIFYESSSNDGSLTNELEIQLAGYVNWSYYLVKATGYVTFSPPLPSGLTAKISTDLTTQTAILKIEGSTTDEVSGEYTVTINSSLLPISESERTKVIQLEFNENIGITYEDISPNMLIGPNADYQGNIETPYGYCRLRYDNGEFSLYIDEDSKLRVGLQNAGMYSIRKFSKGDLIYASYDYGDALSSFSDGLWESDVYNLDVSDLNDGDLFYFALRGEACDVNQLAHVLGWVEMQKIGSPGDDCEAILVKDFAFRSTSDYTYIFAGSLSEPLVRFYDTVLKEDLVTDGVFNEIEMNLEGGYNFQVSSGELNPNQYTFSPYGDSEIPADFDSKVKVTVTGNKTATISISSNWDLSNAEDFKVRFVFASGVLVNPLNEYQYSSDGIITIDFRGEEPILYADYGAPNVSTTVGQDVQKVIDFKHLDQYWGTELGFFYIGDSFIMYKGGNLPYRVEAFCDVGYTTNYSTNGDAKLSSEIQLFDIADFEEEAYTNSVLSEGAFKHIGQGSYFSDNTSYFPEDGEVFISDNRLANWLQNIGSAAYIFVKIHVSCDEAYYGWLRLDIKEDGTITPYFIIYQTTPNQITYDEIPTCESGPMSETVILYIDEVYLDDVSYPSNQGINNIQNGVESGACGYYSDFTDIKATAFPGSTLSLSVIQGFQSNINVDPHEHYAEYWGAWIDYNGDGYFAMDNEELIAFNETDETLDIDFQLPNNISPGLYKMRIILSVHNFYSACSFYQHGETEDYTIEVLDPSDVYCDDVNLFITETITGYETLSAVVSIEAENIVAPSANVNIKAGESILLKPGFIAHEGANFRAYIKECNQILPKAEETMPTSSLSSITTYPNPFDEEVKVDFELKESGDLSLFIFNVNGQIMTEEVKYYDTGRHSLSINTSHLVSGMYILKLVGKDFDEQIKLVKMQ